MADTDSLEITHLADTPVLGVPMGNVSLLRLDLVDKLAPGNKRYKLAANLAQARQLGVRRLVSFGGAWSNHLHALAALGREQGFATVGIVRGEAGVCQSATLADASAWGMRIVNVSRSEYRRRNDGEYQAQLEQRFGPCLIIPEGGCNSAGMRGCMDIASGIVELAPRARRVILPVGTGTTLAGLAAGLDNRWEVLGVSALKGATDLEQRVEQVLRESGATACASWQILHQDHCGGFARVSDELREFMLAFERAHGVPLEPVYTGKMLLAIHQRLRSGQWGARIPLLAVHTGGLQGRRGFSW